MNKFLKIISSVLPILFFSLSVSAQQTAQLKVTTASEPKEGEPIVVLVTPNPANLSLNKVTFYFRAPGSNFQSKEMSFDKGLYTFTIPANKVVPPSLEYYVIATKNDGTNLIFPAISSEQPEVDVQNSPAFFSVKPVTVDETVTILMGEPGATAAAEDFIIMMSYYRISEQIDIKSIKLTVNGQDVTSKSTVTSDALTYLPETPPEPGTMEMSFSAKMKDGSAVGPISWKTTTATTQAAEEIESQEKNFNLSGNIWDELRYEKVAGTGTGYHRANLSASGNYKWLNFSTNLYGTSEEKSYLQPSNRYTFKLMSEYLDLGFGDVYPSFSRLVMNGTRVRGFEANLKLKAINIDVTSGQMVRGIEATFDNNDSYPFLNTPLQTDSLTSKGYVLVTEGGIKKFKKKISDGAYERSLTAAKISFGDKTDGFNWGLTALKAIDDTSSNLNSKGSATANVAFGSDMQWVMDNNRFNWYADGAFSAYNSDIRAPLDTTIENNLPVSKSTIEKIIPITNSVAAPFNGKQALDYIAMQTGLKLNYWNNFLKAEYVRYGASYKSDGISFLQNDIQGLKFSDRLRLWQNKFIISAGFDRLTDNLNGSKDVDTKIVKSPGDTTIVTTDGTTTKQIIRAGVAVFPGGKWPSLSVDFIQNKNDNVLSDSSVASAKNASKTFQISSSYGFSVGEAFHSVSLSLSFTNKADDRNRKIFLDRFGISPVDQKNRSIFLSYNTTIGNDLSVGGSYTNSFSSYEVANNKDANGNVKPDSLKGTVGYATSEKRETTFNIFEANAVKMLFDNKLKVGVRANATLSDNNQFILGGNAEYTIIKNLYATYDLNYFINSGTDSITNETIENDFITALRLQWVF